MDVAKWTPSLRACVVLAFVEEKRRGLRVDTFNNDAWSRVLTDFNRLAGVTFEKGQVVNQLSIIKKLVRGGGCNKKESAADPSSSLTDIGINSPRLLDNLMENSLISDDDWEIFLAEAKLTAGRPYVAVPSSSHSEKKRSKSNIDADVVSAEKKQSKSDTEVEKSPVASNARPAASTSIVASPVVDSASSAFPSTAAAVASIPVDSSVIESSVQRNLFPVHHSSSSSSSSSKGKSSKKSRHEGLEVPVFKGIVKKEESKMEAAMKIINKDFIGLTGEEQLMVGLALTQPNYLELFLSLGLEGKQAFVSKFKN